MRRGPLTVAAALAAILATSAAYPQARLWLALNVKAENPERPSIAMLGDSHFEIVNWKILTGCPNVANFGFHGDRTDQVLARLPQVIKVRPKLIVVMAGTNDALQGIEGAIILRNLRLIEEIAVANGIDVLVLSPPPLDGVSVPAIPEAVPVPFADSDLGPDHIHLRRTAYEKLQAVVEPFVEKFCN